ncbi:hypothetical protein X769_22455 [Mesorhizobium sp. LSJC268A00]|nr:hypothetical protein X769_22455 [Mesorhizobium sp. LSJC268A00]
MIHAENERSTARTLRGDAYALTFLRGKAELMRHSITFRLRPVTLGREAACRMGGLGMRQEGASGSGLASKLMRLGWFCPRDCKSIKAQEVRAVLTARKLVHRCSQ